MEIDTINKHLVSTVPGGVIMLSPPRTPLTSMEAKSLAAWLITMAEMNEPESDADFDDILQAIQNT